MDDIPSSEVCKRLGMSRQSFQQSGLSALIHKYEPFGPRYPLYDSAEVAQWVTALKRRTALIELGKRTNAFPLAQAMGLDPDMDIPCPRCQGWAYADNGESIEDYIKMINDGTFPSRWWCEQCGVCESDESGKNS